MPHATSATERRRSSSIRPNGHSLKFPDFAQEHADEHELAPDDISRGPSPAPLLNGLPAGMHSSERWPVRKDARNNLGTWANGHTPSGRHGRQKSLSEAIQTVRARKGSITANASEIAESLKAPVSPRLVLLCSIWYGTSILSNASSKAILTAFPRPITLTVMQFFMVCSWCLFLSWLAKRSTSVRNALPVLKNGIRKPSREIIMATLPLTAFQIGGHILNADAMSRIPVSLVHTIKGLSPLMTVVAYRVFFNVYYAAPTYLSLVPLTLGVIMACSASFQGNLIGLSLAFGSAILFVTQNIVSKKIFNDAAKAEQDGTPVNRRKPDKLNLLCYSSGLAFLLTFPIWLWFEGLSIAADYYQDGTIDLRERPGSLDHGALAAEYFINGTFHFSQSLVAFILLGMVSPVTYSVASLIKRVAVIIFAIVWFGNPMTALQGFGFALTFLGLYLYDRTSDAAKADRRAREKLESADPLLPLSAADARKADVAVLSTSPVPYDGSGHPSTGLGGYSNGEPVGIAPERRNGSPHMNGTAVPLPMGTKAETTWDMNDMVRQQNAPVR